MTTQDEKVGETALYHGPELRWPRHYKRFLLTLTSHGERPATREQTKELHRQALSLMDAMIEAVNRKLPDHCAWPAGDDAVYGPAGAPLPDMAELVEAAFVEVVRQAALDSDTERAGQRP